jgi:hypothetical protein
VRPIGPALQLIEMAIAGHAVARPGEVPVVVRDAETEDADRAVENIARKQLNPYEEAKAVHAMLDRGLTQDGAAQALGWPKARVTARVKILELPERAQQLIGEGVIALSAVDQLRAIGNVAPALLGAVVAYLDEGNAWAAERLAREPGWVLDAAMQHSRDKTFAAYLDSASSHAIAELRLGKETDALYAEAEQLHRQLDCYAYGPPQVRLTDADVDQARRRRADRVRARPADHRRPRSEPPPSRLWRLASPTSARSLRLAFVSRRAMSGGDCASRVELPGGRRSVVLGSGEIRWPPLGRNRWRSTKGRAVV